MGETRRHQSTGKECQQDLTRYIAGDLHRWDISLLAEVSVLPESYIADKDQISHISEIYRVQRSQGTALSQKRDFTLGPEVSRTETKMDHDRSCRQNPILQRNIPIAEVSLVV